MFSLFSSERTSPINAARLQRIERKLDLLLEHLGIDATALDQTALDADIRELAESGEKIAAIKLHRDRHGSSLLEAKQAVEALMR